MPLTLPPPLPTREDALPRRLDSIAARLRRVVVIRSGSWLVAIAVLFLGILAYIDQRFHLPALVRALGLVTFLIGLPLLVRRWISRPLTGSGDPVRIALRVERAYPEFNDSLVSAVQFLRQGPDDRSTSPVLRSAAFRRAARKAERYEFDRAVDARGLKRSVLVALAVCAVAAWLVSSAPEAATASALRLAMPFGGTSAPTKTKIEIVAPQPLPHRMARGEPLDVRLFLRGAIPDRVFVAVRMDGSAPIDQSYAALPDEGSPELAELTIRLEATRIPRDFQFRVRANDADTGWQSVHVLPPP